MEKIKKMRNPSYTYSDVNKIVLRTVENFYDSAFIMKARSGSYCMFVLYLTVYSGLSERKLNN